MSSTQRYYLDYAASAPLGDASKFAMQLWNERAIGNPSSLHQEGQKAKREIDKAREIVARSLNAAFDEIIFTSGGTESAYLAIIGTALANKDSHRKKILISKAEHHCCLGTRSILERIGYRVEFLEVDTFARVQLEDLDSKMDDSVLLVVTMHANNEYGSYHSVKEIADIVHAKGGHLFVDCVQTFGVEMLDVTQFPADLISISGHKIGGPIGIGGLWKKPGLKIAAFIQGGGQERELRAGTEPVGNIIGFAAAIEARFKSYMEGVRRSKCPAEDFEKALGSSSLIPTLPSFSESAQIQRHPLISHFQHPFLLSDSILIRLDRAGISAGAGAACSAGSPEPSHVMLASGLSPEQSKRGLRFSFAPDHDPDLLSNAAQLILYELREMEK